MSKINELLNAFVSDQKNAPNIYKPSKYWWRKSLSAVREIKKNGLYKFRSSSNVNTAGASYADGNLVDYHRLVETSSLFNRLGLAVLNLPGLRRLFDSQVNATKRFSDRLLELEKTALILLNPERFTELVENDLTTECHI